MNIYADIYSHANTDEKYLICFDTDNSKKIKLKLNGYETEIDFSSANPYVKKVDTSDKPIVSPYLLLLQR